MNIQGPWRIAKDLNIVEQRIVGYMHEADHFK